MAENDDGNSGGGLRAQLEAALALNKEQSARLATLENGERRRALATTVVNLGGKPGSENFYPADADTSEASVTQWLEANASMFKLDEKIPGLDPRIPVTTNSPLADAARRLQAVSDAGTDRSAGDLNDINDRMQNAKTPAELHEILAEFQLVRTD